jgi:hypothetical protein
MTFLISPSGGAAIGSLPLTLINGWCFALGTYHQVIALANHTRPNRAPIYPEVFGVGMT